MASAGYLLKCAAARSGLTLRSIIAEIMQIDVLKREIASERLPAFGQGRDELLRRTAEQDFTLSEQYHITRYVLDIGNNVRCEDDYLVNGYLGYVAADGNALLRVETCRRFIKN